MLRTWQCEHCDTVTDTVTGTVTERHCPRIDRQANNVTEFRDLTIKRHLMNRMTSRLWSAAGDIHAPPPSLHPCQLAACNEEKQAAVTSNIRPSTPAPGEL